ncbi:MAG: recombination protein O N-terminal domain-containing protein [Patescibacteria group bacterium]
MSYHIYTTEGIVLKRMGSGEADVSVYLLTQDLGLVMAKAKSARLSASKLRSGLEEYTSGTFSLIKSKNGWKITNVVEKENFFFSTPVYSRKLLAQISAVLIKMIAGEYPQHDIYELVHKSFGFLKGADPEDLPGLEVLTVLRVLNLLGYVEGGVNLDRFLQDSEFSKDVISETILGKRELVFVINKALKESQL